MNEERSEKSRGMRSLAQQNLVCISFAFCLSQQDFSERTIHNRGRTGVAAEAIKTNTGSGKGRDRPSEFSDFHIASPLFN
jgi:hypothetical protein